MISKNTSSFWTLLKRPKIDYVTICVGFLLLASNQVFTYSPFHPTGALDVSLGSSIPQDTNYTLTEINDQAIRSAIIFNESMSKNHLSIDVIVDAMNKTICNITLESPIDNTPVDIYFDFGDYSSHIEAVVGQDPVTYTILPSITAVKSYGDLYATCHVRIYSDVELILRNALLWAEFGVPVSPLVLDYKTTDGYDLLENEYTRWISMDGLEFNLIRLSDGKRGWINIEYQNYTLYLQNQNYTVASLWGNEYDSILQFNITLHENITTHCLIHMKAIRVYFTIDSNFPLIRLDISKYDSYHPEIEIYFDKSNIPNFVYVPPYSLFDIEIATVTPFSRYSYGSDDIVAQIRIHSNKTNDYHVNVILPYLNVIGIVIAPQDFIQIVLALILLLLINLRIFSYLNSKKPRKSWKDPRLIPIIAFLVLACIPWYRGVHALYGASQYPFYVASLGAFPLLGCWTESSSLFFMIPQNGFAWSITALIFVWFPLLLSYHFSTPPSNAKQNIRSSLLLFIPFFESSLLNWSLGEQFSFALESYLSIYLSLIPVTWLLFIIFLAFRGYYNYGPNKDQLAFDAKLSPQILDSKIVPKTEESASVQRYNDENLEADPQKTLDLVMAMLFSALLLLPITFDIVILGGDYNATYYVSPMNALQKLFIALFGLGGVSTLWILLLPLFYFIILGLWYNLTLKSRPILSVILFIIWLCLPLVFLSTLYGIVYGYYFQIDWVLISLPYFLLSIMTLQKLQEYIQNKVTLKILLIWVLIPILAIIPGALILSWRSTILLVSGFSQYTLYTFMPLFSLLVLVVIWPLKQMIQELYASGEVDSELDDLLHPDDEVGNL